MLAVSIVKISLKNDGLARIEGLKTTETFSYIFTYG